MNKNSNIFFKKKILIYGLGKSGKSTFSFLNSKSKVRVFDDTKSNIVSKNVKKKFINYKEILQTNFDRIILSPGIDINKCKLSKYLKKNYSKIHTDFDVFFEFNKNSCITVTGTNGKSTTCQLLYEVLLNQKYDVKLAGNIGNPILSVKNIKENTIFILEASSYQLEYSKIFRSKYAIILNLSPDHIERHRNIKNYVNAKFKLIKGQSAKHFAFVKKDDPLILKELKNKRYKSRIIKVDTKKNYKFLKKINNNYFSTEANLENLMFVIEISKKLKLKSNLFEKSIQQFKGLKYRQQIIFKSKKLTIINDSKSTSFASSIGVLKNYSNIFWLIGGRHKKGDKFILPKKYFKNIKAYIYGKNKTFFNEKLKNKIIYKNYQTLKDALRNILIVIKKDKLINQTIIFSPSAASFDSFKNFEDRGAYFNKLVRRYISG
tara:strand:+ start:427 stop:1725 length:1299 start_codon:yes stop_codon:yes gene_type:complete